VVAWDPVEGHRAFATLVLTNWTLAAAAGCGGDWTDGSADGGVSGTATSLAGGAGRAGDATAGSFAPADGGACEPAGGTTLVVSESDPACIDLQMPAALDFVFDAADAALICEDHFVSFDTCGGGGPYVPFEYETEEIYLWIEFAPVLVSAAATEARLREHFLGLWYQLRIPAPVGGEPFLTDPLVVRDLADASSFSFANGRLHLKLSTSVDRLLRWTQPVGGSCYDTDIGSLICACKYPVCIPSTVELDLAFPG